MPLIAGTEHIKQPTVSLQPLRMRLRLSIEVNEFV